MNYDFKSAIEHVQSSIKRVLEQFQENVNEILIENQRFYCIQGETALDDLGIRIQRIDGYLDAKYREHVFFPTKHILQQICNRISEVFDPLFAQMEQYANENQLDEFENMLRYLYNAFATSTIIYDDFNHRCFEELYSVVGTHFSKSNFSLFDPMENAHRALNETCNQTVNKFFDQIGDLNDTLKNEIEFQLSTEIDRLLQAKEEMSKKEKLEEQSNKQMDTDKMAVTETKVEVSGASTEIELSDKNDTQKTEQDSINSDVVTQQLLAQEEEIRQLKQLIAEQKKVIATKDQETERLKADNTRLQDAKDELIQTVQDEINTMKQAQSQPKSLTNEEDLEQTYQLLHSLTDEQKQEFYKSSKSQEALEELISLKLNESVESSHQELLDELILTLIDGKSSVTVEENKKGIGHK